MKNRLPPLLLAAALAVTLLLPAPAQAAETRISTLGFQVLRQTDRHRMQMGLRPLSYFDELQAAANTRADEQTESFSHTRPDGQLYSTVFQELRIPRSTFGENIAMGYATPSAVMTGWLNSPGHRANIENADYLHMGAGYAYGGTAYWSQEFLAANSCAYSGGLMVEGDALTGAVGADLDQMLSGATLRVHTYCAAHGVCTFPVVAEMCSGYNANAAGTQTVTITVEGMQTTVPVTLSGGSAPAGDPDPDPIPAPDPEPDPEPAQDSWHTFTLPDDDIGWYASFVINAERDDRGRIQAGTSAGFQVKTPDDYTLVSAQLRLSDGRVIPITDLSSWDNDTVTEGNFSMPAADARLEVTYRHAYAGTVVPGDYVLNMGIPVGGNYSVLTPGKQGTGLVSAGSKVQVHAIPHSGKELATLLLRYENGTAQTLIDNTRGGDYTDTVTFAMPPADVELEYNFVPKGASETPLPFTDVDGHWAKTYITYAYRHNLFSGTSATQGSLTAFADRNAVSTYAVTPMRWAVENGLISGTSANRLSPQGKATRAQVATIMARFDQLS